MKKLFLFLFLFSFGIIYSKEKSTLINDSSLVPIQSSDLFHGDTADDQIQSVNPSPLLIKRDPPKVFHSLLENQNAEKIAFLSKSKAKSLIKKQDNKIFTNEIFPLTLALKVYKKMESKGLINDQMIEGLFTMLKDEHFCHFYIKEPSEKILICNDDFTAYLFSNIYISYDKNPELKPRFNPTQFMLFYIGVIDKILYIHQFKVKSIILETLMNTKLSFLSYNEVRRINFN